MRTRRRLALSVLTIVFAFLPGVREGRSDPPFTPSSCPNPDSGLPSDPRFGQQWFHDNQGGTAKASVDADLDTPFAWQCTLGSPNILLAVIDSFTGFDVNHEDLKDNLYTNVNDHAIDQVDNDDWDTDPQTFVDDIHGWDFIDTPPFGDNSPGPGNHGTSMVGLVAAKANSLGVRGVCPQCRFLPIRAGTEVVGKAIDYAIRLGARVISLPPFLDIDLAQVQQAISAAGPETVIIIGGGNRNTDECTPNNIQSLPDLITVSSSTSRDAKASGNTQLVNGACPPCVTGGEKCCGSVIGDCVDLLAPSWHEDNCKGTPTVCTRPIVTTKSAGGYDELFGGVSASRSIAAGAAGLLLSVQPGLSRLQIQRLLQDTTDKVEPSKAAYDPKTGFSSPWELVDIPGSGGGTTKVRHDLPATHAWGRINVFEAVRLLAPASRTWSTSDNKWKGGAGVDIFLRDNTLDWGNTEQPSDTRFEPTADAQRPKIPDTEWQSPDIKVDLPEFLADASQSAAGFDAFEDEAGMIGADSPAAKALTSGTMTQVYIRARNRGPVTASDVAARLYWAWKDGGPTGSDAIPKLPGGFWTSFQAGLGTDNQGAGGWHSVAHGMSQGPHGPVVQNPFVMANLPYSGPSVAGCPTRQRPSCDPSGVNDDARIATFPFKVPVVQPGETRELYLLAILDSPQDPVGQATKSDLSPTHFVPRDNNVALRRIPVKAAS